MCAVRIDDVMIARYRMFADPKYKGINRLGKRAAFQHQSNLFFIRFHFHQS